MDRKPRGRPRQFDEDEVLEKALQLFWKKGFSATSLDDISAATKLTRPSLYAAFGDKQSMYRKTLAKFSSQFIAKIEQALNSTNELRTDLIEFYTIVLTEYRPNSTTTLGCPVICTAVSEAYLNESIRNDIAKSLTQIDKLLERRFKLAIERKQIPNTLDPTSLGRISGAILHSLAVRVRAKQKGTHLKKLIEEYVDQIVLRLR